MPLRLSCAFFASAAVCCVLLRARATLAQDLGPTLLVYQAPTDCPPVGQFQRSVQRRSTRIHFVDEGSHDRQLSVVLRHQGELTVGELRLIEQNGALRQRSLRFSSCDDALEGLALITTMSLDPRALLREQAPQVLPPVPTAPAPTAAPPPGPSPLAKPPRTDERRVETELGAEFNVYFDALPRAAIGGGVFATAGLDSRRWFAPQIRGSVTHVEQRGEPVALQGTANFALTLGGLAACPLALAGRVFSFRPCASLSAGVLRIWSTRAADPQTRTRPYASWGGAGFFSWRLAEAVKIVVEGGIGVPLERDRFTFGGPPFWTTRAVYFASGFGVSFRLP